MSLIKQIANGESKTVEFKEILPQNSVISKTIVAFSNTSGGKLIIGVDDDKNIVGIDDKNIFEIKDKIASVIYDSCYPNILPKIYTITINSRSETRNKVLANLFKELELIEKWGTGINRIKKLCLDKGLREPLFSEKNDFIDIEFPREIKTTQETTQETKKLSTKKKIVQELIKDKTLTRDELSEIIGVSSSAIKQHLSNLKKDGLIKRVGSTKSGYWEIINKLEKIDE